jgi:uncharacterized protein
MPIVTPPETCDKCGCCCWLHVEVEPGDNIPKEHVDTVKTDLGDVMFMKKGEDGFCIYLDRATGRCTVYGKHPKTCRDFERGCRGCLEAIYQAKRGVYAGVLPGTTPMPTGGNVSITFSALGRDRGREEKNT